MERATSWETKSKFIDEELEFYTELALHETERWIQAVTRKKLQYPDDMRRSLEDGVLLCLLANGLRQDIVKKINLKAGPITGLDNINVFLDACKEHFGLKDSQLFHACDLEDLTRRSIFDDEEELKQEIDRRLRNVAITIFWLGKYAKHHFEGPQLDFSAFSDLVNHHQYKSVLQLSPSPSASSHSRSEDSDSTASGSLQGSPRSPVKRNLTLQSVQEDLVEPESPTEQNDENATLVYQGRYAKNDNQTHLDNQPPFHNYTDTHQINQSTSGLSKDFSREGIGNTEDITDQEYSDLVIKPPSPFAEDNDYEQHNQIKSSPTRNAQIQNQSHNLPPLNTQSDYFYEHRRQPSTDSVGYSSAHGSSYSLESKTPSQSEYHQHSPQHVRTNSYDSVLSEDLNEDKNGEVHQKENSRQILPVRDDLEDNKANMSGNEEKNTNVNIRYSATFDAVYDQENRLDDSGSVGSPDSSLDDYNRFRYGDSGDGSSSHSRSSSLADAGVVNKYRRTSSTTAPPTNPLQFVKPNKNSLAEQAKETINVMTKQKEIKTKVEHEAEDWQTDLSSWKSKMRKKSYGTYVEAMKAEEANVEEPPRKAKTFGEMMKSREQRKGMSFYPLDDDDDVFKSKQSGSTQKSSFAKSSFDDEEPKDNNSITVETKKEEIETRSSSSRLSDWRRDEEETRVTDRWNKESENTNNSQGAKPARSWSDDDGEEEKNNTECEEKQSSVGARFSTKHDVAPWAESTEADHKSRDMESPPRRSPPKTRSKDFKIIDNHEEYQPTYRKDFVRKEPSPPETAENSGLTPSALFADDKPKEEKPKSTVPQIDERANRFGSLLRNFQKSAKSNDSEPAPPKSTVGKIKVASIFDKDDPLEQEEKEKKRSWMKNREMRTKDSLPASLSSISSSSVRPDRSFKHEGDLRPHVLKKRQWEQQLKTEPAKTEPEQEYVEKIIRMSKPAHNESFGFSIMGGKEQDSPIYVEYVTAGTVADECGLKAGDVISSINGAEVASHFRESVMHVINQAVDSGQLELRVKRHKDSDRRNNEKQPDVVPVQNQPSFKGFRNDSKVESDEDSQASQDSMIVYDTQDNTNTDSEMRPEEQRTEDPGPVTTPFQADWVPPWRIKSGRVQAPQPNTAIVEEPERESVSAEPVAPWRNPAPSSDKQPEPDHSSRVHDDSARKTESKDTDNLLNEKSELPPASSVTLPWTKKYGSKEDLLKPQAPTPWKSDNEDNSSAPASGSHFGSDLLPDVSNKLSDGQISVGLSRSDGQQSIGLGGRKGGHLLGRNSPGVDSVSSINSAEERLEAEIMDRLEMEAKQEEKAEKRHFDVLADEMNDSNLTESSNTSTRPPWMSRSTEEEDEPPALPSEPPPAPNWNTFPSPSGGGTADSFMDSGDAKPAPPPTKMTEIKVHHEKSEPKKTGLERVDSTTRIKVEQLSRRAQFLGVPLEELEEYKKLQLELAETKKKKQEEGMWRSLQTEDTLVAKIGQVHISTKAEDIRADVYKPPVNSLWDRIEAPTHDYDPASGKPAYGSHYGLEEQERNIIENLEREERERQRREAQDEDYIDPWKEKYKEDQFKLDRQYKSDLDRSRELEVEKNRKDLEIMEKEKAHQMELELKYAQQQEERRKQEEERRQLEEWRKKKEREEEEKRRREEEKAREEQRRFELLRKEEEDRLRRVEERKKLEKERKQEQERKREEEKRRIEEDKRKIEEEKRREIERQIELDREAERRIEDEKRRQEERQKAQKSSYPWNTPNRGSDNAAWKHISPEKEQYVAHQREYSDDSWTGAGPVAERRRQEELEAQQLKEKEEQLRAMEERIKHEAEQLKLERERLQHEKAERHRLWNMESNNSPQSAGKIREMSDVKYGINSQTEHPSNIPFPVSDYSQPLHVETDRPVYAVSGGPSPALRKTPPRSSEPTYSNPEQYNNYGREHSPPEKLEPNVQSGYDRRVNENIGMSKSKSENWMETYREPTQSKHQRYGSESGLASKPAPAIAKKPLLLKKEPLSSQYGGQPGNYENVYRGNNSDVQLRNKRNVQQDEELKRHSFAPEATSVAAARDEAMRVSRRPKSSHDDSSPSLNPNRRSWHETTPDRSFGEPMSKPNLHELGATPKQRLRSTEDWIKADEDKKEEQRRKHAEVMRKQFPNPADHWMVEEAERRRMAEQSGRERLQKLQSRQQQIAQAAQQYPQYRSAVDHDNYIKPHQYDLSEGSTSGLSPHAADLYRQTGQSPHSHSYKPPAPPPTHVMEHIEAPDTDRSRPARPIPDTIKQTLIQRVTSPKSPGRSSYSPPEPPASSQYQQSPRYSQPSSYPTGHNQPTSSQYNQYGEPVPYRYSDEVPYTGSFSPPSASSAQGYHPHQHQQYPPSSGYPQGPSPQAPQTGGYYPAQAAPASHYAAHPHHDAPVKPPRSGRDDPGPSRAEQSVSNSAEYRQPWKSPQEYNHNYGAQKDSRTRLSMSSRLPPSNAPTVSHRRSGSMGGNSAGYYDVFDPVPPANNRAATLPAAPRHVRSRSSPMVPPGGGAMNPPMLSPHGHRYGPEGGNRYSAEAHHRNQGRPNPDIVRSTPSLNTYRGTPSQPNQRYPAARSGYL